MLISRIIPHPVSKSGRLVKIVNSKYISFSGVSGVIKVVSKPNPVNLAANSVGVITGKTSFFSKYSQGIAIIYIWYGTRDLHPHVQKTSDPKSDAYTIPPIPQKS